MQRRQVWLARLGGSRTALVAGQSRREGTPCAERKWEVRSGKLGKIEAQAKQRNCSSKESIIFIKLLLFRARRKGHH